MAALAAAAARPDPVETLQEEAICAICLDYFADPVSIGCGHNFCRGCISRLWAHGEDEEDEDEDEDEEEDALDVEQEEDDEEENGGGGAVEEEEDDEMWEEEEEDEDEEGALWEEPAEDEDDDEEEEEEEEEEEPSTWRGEDNLYFTDNDYDEDAMEEDVEEEEEQHEDEDDDDDDDEDDEGHHATPPLFTCPQCRKSFFQRDFRPNLQLANMVQIIRELHPRPAGVPGILGVPGVVSGVSGVPTAPGGPPELCPEHQEPLKLFCQEEQAAICVVCREARQHRRHSVLPLDEAVQECKKQLQRHLEPLREQLDAVLKQKSSEEEKISVLRDQLRAEAQDLEDAVAALQRFVAAERALQLRRLRERHEAQLALQRRNVAALELHRSALQRRIAQAEAAARQDGLQMLKDIKGTLLRCENIKFQEPEMVPVDLGKKFRNCFLQDAVMRKMEKVFSKVPQADITLDPSTAHPRLILSHDRRSVRLSERRADVSRRCDGDLCVLGTPGFGAGRHYWEVEVGGRRGWAVGAAGETHQHRDKTGAASPKREIWALGASGKKYQALTATEQTALAPGEEPRRFGVYLDYERGQLGFYNAESMSHIHTFHIRCRQRVFPFFRVLAKGTRIRICTR